MVPTGPLVCGTWPDVIPEAAKRVERTAMKIRLRIRIVIVLSDQLSVFGPALLFRFRWEQIEIRDAHDEDVSRCLGLHTELLFEAEVEP